MTKVDEPEPLEPIAADDDELRRAAGAEAGAEVAAVDLPQAETLRQYLHVVWVRSAPARAACCRSSAGSCSSRSCSSRSTRTS